MPLLSPGTVRASACPDDYRRAGSPPADLEPRRDARRVVDLQRLDLARREIIVDITRSDLLPRRSVYEVIHAAVIWIPCVLDYDPPVSCGSELQHRSAAQDVREPRRVLTHVFSVEEIAEARLFAIGVT